MSSSVGEAVHEGKVIGYFQWSNTSDTAWDVVYDTAEELRANWNQHHKAEREIHRSGWCASLAPIAIMLRVDRGSYADSWSGKMCPKCRRIIDGTNPYSLD